MALKRINPEEWTANPFEAIGKQWLLLTAGNEADGWNTMTCSWGALGVMWNKPALTCYVRHSRHTFGFMEQQDTFTVTFFGEEQRKALAFCGAHSGRDCDKAAETGLHPVTIDGGVTFSEAKAVLVCKKKFASDIDPNALPADIRNSFYADGDAHKMYIGEITACYIAE